MASVSRNPGGEDCLLVTEPVTSQLRAAEERMLVSVPSHFLDQPSAPPPAPASQTDPGIRYAAGRSTPAIAAWRHGSPHADSKRFATSRRGEPAATNPDQTQK